MGNESTDNPVHLYKYRSLKGEAKERTKNIITESTIWFSSPADFNDPFDCSPVLSLQESRAERLRYAASLLRSNAPSMDRNQRRQMLRFTEQRLDSPEVFDVLREQRALSVNFVGILSLSALPNQVLMWSHYAEAHTGICLRFNRSSPWAFPFIAAQKVIYSAERPVLNPITDTDPDNAQALVDKVILTKADFWAHEEEWRVMSHPNSSIGMGGPGLTTFAPRALDGIILGACISDADAAAVARWTAVRKYPVELLRAQPDSDRFRINIVPFTAPSNNERILEISGSKRPEATDR